ncbi:hypothetical protein [Halobacterium rubrum]|uniref:hypothetical protein n=1 Tax=Halobacterium TaxID=2239 RepID=UPI001F34CF59|nr:MULTISPECIES: hypothetical protein [Halobacterium]MDH5021666.1 hypothetical protein [Halobacterium rubrum]
MPVQTRRSERPSTSDRHRVEVSEMTAAGVAAYADTHDDAYIERRGGRTFVVTRE